MDSYAKIVVKNEYKKKGDLVFRPLKRAYEMINANKLMRLGNAFIIGTVNRDGEFIEFFTNKPIDYDGYESISYGDVEEILRNLKKEDIKNIQSVIRKFVFNERIFLPYENHDYIAQDIKNRDIDLKIANKAYEDGLSLINPFDKENLNAYNDFQCLIQNAKKIREEDEIKEEPKGRRK